MKHILPLAICCATCIGQQERATLQNTQWTSTPQFSLHIRSSHRISVPLFSYSSASCDTDGNIFFDISGFYSIPSVLRVNRDGSQVLPIPLPVGLYKKGQWNFSVANDGGIYLLSSQVDDPLLVHLASSGEVISQLRVSLPKPLNVSSFAVSSGGAVAVYGTVLKIGSKSSGSQGDSATHKFSDVPFLYWLEPTGTVAHKIEFGSEFSRTQSMPNGLVLAGPQNKFYTVTSKEIREYGPTGLLFRVIPILAPNPDAQISGAQYLAGKTTLLFSYPSQQNGNDTSTVGQASNSAPYYGPLDQVWLVVNTVSGETEGVYKHPDDVEGAAVCSVGNTFIYTILKAGQLYTVEAER